MGLNNRIFLVFEFGPLGYTYLLGVTPNLLQELRLPKVEKVTFVGKGGFDRNALKFF